MKTALLLLAYAKGSHELGCGGLVLSPVDRRGTPRLCARQIAVSPRIRRRAGHLSAFPRQVIVATGARDHWDRVGAGRMDSCRLATFDWGSHRIEPQRTVCHWAYHHPAPWSRSSELWLLRRILPSTVAVVFSARRSRPSRDLRTVANRSEEI